MNVLFLVQVLFNENISFQDEHKFVWVQLIYFICQILIFLLLFLIYANTEKNFYSLQRHAGFFNSASRQLGEWIHIKHKTQEGKKFHQCGACGIPGAEKGMLHQDLTLNLFFFCFYKRSSLIMKRTNLWEALDKNKHAFVLFPHYKMLILPFRVMPFCAHWGKYE